MFVKKANNHYYKQLLFNKGILFLFIYSLS